MIDTTLYLEHSKSAINRIIRARCIKESPDLITAIVGGKEKEVPSNLVLGKVYTVAVVSKNFFCKGEAYYVLDLDSYDLRKESMTITYPKGILGTVPYWDSADGFLEEIPNSLDFILDS